MSYEVEDFDLYEVELNNGQVITATWRCLRTNLIPIYIVQRFTKIYCAIA